MATDLVSPCRKICIVDIDTLVCRGCGRSTREIAAWPTAKLAEKKLILRVSRNRMIQNGWLDPEDTPPNPAA